MRQVVTSLNIAGSLIIYAMTINFFEHAAMFLLFGILPDRTEPVPANLMLVSYVASGSLIVAYVARRGIANTLSAAQTVYPFVLPIALRLIGKWHDRFGPQLKLLKQESLLVRLTRR